MTSLIVDLLQPSGKLTRENINFKVDDLKRKFEFIKMEVQKSLKNRYIDFVPQYVKLDKILESLSEVANEYNELNVYIEKEIRPVLVESVIEFNDVVGDLQKIKKLKEMASNLCSLHNSLEDAKTSLTNNYFLQSAHCLLEFENEKNIDSDCQTDISILKSLTTEFIVAKENLIYHLENSWHEIIVISSSLEGRKKLITMKVDRTNNIEYTSEILIALKLLKQLRPVLKEFGKRFLNIVCENVILNTIKLEISEDSSILTIIIIKEHTPEPAEVLKSLQRIFNFLYDGVFQAPVNLENNEKCSDTAMFEFGKAIKDEFCSLLIEKCLKAAVPKQSKEMETFRSDIAAAENFFNHLQGLGFFFDTENRLYAFIHDVDILPVNKIAQEFLSKSRSCMKKSLHQTITVGIKPSQINDSNNTSRINEISGTEDGLSKSSFSFPECKISESVKELVFLLYEVKNEARNIDTTYVPKLYYVSRNICELYCCVVPVYHKEEIMNIPQQTAIFHNNCMYLAHNLSTIGTLFEKDLEHSISLTFVDLVTEIRKLGTEAFLVQMRQQKQQLLQLLQDQAYGNVMIDDSAVMKAEKAVRQCLCQLQLLKKVWSDVLPVEVYFKAIGTLINTCLEEIIMRILSMEDIAAEAAAHLDSTFEILLKQSPDLFMASSIDKRNFIHFYVKRWFKFQELQLVLSASMREIVDRWASGKGPLATHFTSDEVKHLIRAIFQNTERRAAALAKIR